MKPTISLLLGSGFSIPEGIPGMKSLNKSLSKIDESKIMIHTSQIAIFLNNQEDNNRWSRRDERLFLQEFLEFYNHSILNPGQEFNYETFFDFYSDYIYHKKNKIEIENFYEDFVREYFSGNDNSDCLNRLLALNRTYNQLLASLLHKKQYFEDVSFSSYGNHGSFWAFLIEILKTYNVKVHTLNHDLFFEFVGQHHSDLCSFFSDGFQLEGSPFYGTLTHTFNQGTNDATHKSYHVKLERFVDKYDTQLCLFKLHGSIFNVIVHPIKPNGLTASPIRIKNNFGISEYKMEVIDPVTGNVEFTGVHDEVAPDFLSGTTTKILSYSDDPYYKKLFEHFSDNLQNSEYLVVIGYGFQDSGINKYLENNFLSRGKKMIVIDPTPPDCDLIHKYCSIVIKKGVTEVSLDEYLTCIRDNNFARRN